MTEDEINTISRKIGNNLIEDEINFISRKITSNVINMLYDQCAGLPSSSLYIIPLGVAASIFTAAGLNRQIAIAVLNAAFNDIEKET